MLGLCLSPHRCRRPNKESEMESSLNTVKGYYRFLLAFAFIFCFVTINNANANVKKSNANSPISDFAFYKEDVTSDEYIKYDAKDFNCLAENIYYESAHQPLLGKFGVAQVTLNRAKNGKGICGAVYEPSQFSWTAERPRKTKTPKGPEWEVCKDIARDVLEDGVRVQGFENAWHFHNLTVNPNWRKKVIAIIGFHKFYE